jgi:LysM repeat protein
MAYRMQPGDDLQAISSKCGSTVYQLAAANNISDVNLIVAGDLLTIPGCPGKVRAPQCS